MCQRRWSDFEAHCLPLPAIARLIVPDRSWREQSGLSLAVVLPEPYNVRRRPHDTRLEEGQILRLIGQVRERTTARVAMAMITLAFVIAAATYGWMNPLFEAPDELWHFMYVEHLKSEHSLPVAVQSAGGLTPRQE